MKLNLYKLFNINDSKILINILISFIILILCIIFFLKFYYKKTFNKKNIILKNEDVESNKYQNYHIVCAKYDKDCNFLNEMPIRYTIIEKYKDVPNKANEATSYLYYIINNYYYLQDNIIFIHDENESWHHTGKITENVYKWINEYENNGSTYYEFNDNIIEKNYDYYNNNKGFHEYYDKCLKPYIGNFNDIKPEKGKGSAQFIVSRERIHLKPKKFYENIYNWLIKNTSGEGNGDQNDDYSGYHTGRYLEFTWRFIFIPQPNQP